MLMAGSTPPSAVIMTPRPRRRLASALALFNLPNKSLILPLSFLLLCTILVFITPCDKVRLECYARSFDKSTIFNLKGGLMNDVNPERVIHVGCPPGEDPLLAKTSDKQFDALKMRFSLLCSVSVEPIHFEFHMTGGGNTEKALDLSELILESGVPTSGLAHKVVSSSLLYVFLSLTERLGMKGSVYVAHPSTVSLKMRAPVLEREIRQGTITRLISMQRSRIRKILSRAPGLLKGGVDVILALESGGMPFRANIHNILALNDGDVVFTDQKALEAGIIEQIVEVED